MQLLEFLLHLVQFRKVPDHDPLPLDVVALLRWEQRTRAGHVYTHHVRSNSFNIWKGLKHFILFVFTLVSQTRVDGFTFLFFTIYSFMMCHIKKHRAICLSSCTWLMYLNVNLSVDFHNGLPLAGDKIQVSWKSTQRALVFLLLPCNYMSSDNYRLTDMTSTVCTNMDIDIATGTARVHNKKMNEWCFEEEQIYFHESLEQKGPNEWGVKKENWHSWWQINPVYGIIDTNQVPCLFVEGLQSKHN